MHLSALTSGKNKKVQRTGTFYPISPNKIRHREEIFEARKKSTWRSHDVVWQSQRDCMFIAMFQQVI